MELNITGLFKQYSLFKLSDTILPMLKSHGYKPGLRLLTPAHVKVIVEEFGEP